MENRSGEPVSSWVNKTLLSKCQSDRLAIIFLAEDCQGCEFAKIEIEKALKLAPGVQVHLETKRRYKKFWGNLLFRLISIRSKLIGLPRYPNSVFLPKLWEDLKVFSYPSYMLLCKKDVWRIENFGVVDANFSEILSEFGS